MAILASRRGAVLLTWRFPDLMVGFAGNSTFSDGHIDLPSQPSHRAAYRRKTPSQIKRDQERLPAHKQKGSKAVATTDQCLQTPARGANKVNNNNIETDVPVVNDCFRVTRSKSAILPIEQTRTLSTSNDVT